MTPFGWIAVGIVGTLALEAAILVAALWILDRRDRAADINWIDGE